MFEALPDMAFKRADMAPADLAFRDAASGTDWSFAQVNAAADGIAAGLLASGLAEGDRLGILCHNRVEFFLTLFACQKTGIILCPLNWRQPAAELLDTLGPIRPAALLHDRTFEPTAHQIGEAGGARVFGIEDEVAGWIRAGGPALCDPVPASRPWYLLFTSGTTGQPKAVVQTARMAWANAVNIGQAIGLTPDDRSVNYLPLFHTAGINLYTLPVFLNGGASVILPKFEAERVFDLFRAGLVTQFFGVPAVYQAFSLMPDVETIDWSALRCGCGGAPLPEPLIHFFVARGVHVLNGFGMTETGPTAFLMDRGGAEEKIGSVGRAQVLTEVRLEGVAQGQPGQGEIQFRGPAITPGYYDNAQATEQAFTADGWLKSGDVGRRDEDGYYFIIDRIKDMFISGGENVYPAEVERVLHGHPAVLEAAVIGVPDAKWGEAGAAFVMLRPGETLDPEALRPWCRERLAAYKVPRDIRVMADFPRTAAGKVRKPDLRKALEHA